jgi:hypothetical protein
MIENEVSVLGARIFCTTSMAAGLRANAVDLGPFGGGEVSSGRPRRYRLSGVRTKSERIPRVHRGPRCGGARPEQPGRTRGGYA